MTPAASWLESCVSAREVSNRGSVGRPAAARGCGANLNLFLTDCACNLDCMHWVLKFKLSQQHDAIALAIPLALAALSWPWGQQRPHPPARSWPRVSASAGWPHQPPQRAQTVSPWPRKPTLEGARFHHALRASRGTSGMVGWVLRAAMWVHMWHKRWSDTFLPLSPVQNIFPIVTFLYHGGDFKN